MPPPSASDALTPDPALVGRFRADLAALTGEDCPRLLAAVSGGPDSVALLLLARAALGDRCTAATVDHGLRPESAAEARWVAALCDKLGVAHATLTATMPARSGRTANLSARARALRYRLLEDHLAQIGATQLATAHHADDQLETLIMRLNRGAGVSGLAGIRRAGGRVLRPLLGWRRAELAAVVAAAGLNPVDDPSNRDERFDRARLRQALTDTGWLDAERWNRSASALGDAEDALAWTVRTISERYCWRPDPDDDEIKFFPDDLPFELRRRLVLVCLSEVDAEIDVRGGDVVALVHRLESGRPATLGTVLVTVATDARKNVVWTFRPAPPRRSP